MNRAAGKIYSFGRFRLEESERILFDGAETLSLTPKAFDTLLLLVENCGHVLSKEKIMQTVWHDSFVEENNLAQNISLLRRVLGDGKDGAKFIETVSKRGYRFIAAVESFADENYSPLVIVERTRAKISITEKILDETARESDFRPPPAAPAQLKSVSTALPVHKPETHYAQSGDVNIAYQVVGNGDLDIVFVMGWISHVEYFWEHHLFASFLNRLASFSRLILFDKRGTGLSDRVPVNELPTLEQRMDDVRAVLDAAGSERAVLIGVSEGGPMCSLFAATYPERTSALVMFGTYAKRIWEKDYPWAPTAEERESFFDIVRRDWGKAVGIEERAPSMAHDDEFRNWWATYLRMGASPGAAVALTKMNADIDVRAVLPTIRVPTLVIHRSGDMCLKVEEGRFVASQIPACKYVELEGIDHLPFVGDQDRVLEEIEEFLTGVRHPEEHDRVLATVMSIKIVDPEAHALEISNWEELIVRSRVYVRRQIELFKGREVSYDEHGILATFDGPARGIRCALAITDSAGRLGLRVKTGLHTGECDVLGDKYGGFAVKLAENIAHQAEVGEVLVSRTVKDLVAGSGLAFAENSLRTFSGMQGEWRLFHVLRN
jgi:pimeloyl-ACP methyl ester carboxylesterase/DNA-binding winged helix-turn-helix (wHTH) protein/class 3 adenylate cyclase